MNHQEPDYIRTARLAYDAMAPDYHAHHPDTPGNRPLDLALVGALADLVRGNGPAPLADLGCGPGHVTARLQDLGVPVFGVDVSPRTVDLARRTHPGVRFHVGTMTALDLPPDTLGGIAALYAVDHVPGEHLATAFDEFHRVLTPGGHVLVAFRTGDDEHTRTTVGSGQGTALDQHWHAPQTVADHLAKAGLPLRARTLLEPDPGEHRPRAFLLARKPGRPG
ncbi:class I SAM-dependent DNA methyltransferase [Streptomyces sp. NPDC004096]|uniref:class I SAM-dependent DNA methyltransferase n=1 Tax=unclassified Streptomyces TaxID=2593676 RepID=UPI0033B8956D